MKKGVIYILAGVVCAVLATFWYLHSPSEVPLPTTQAQDTASPIVRIGGTNVRVAIAATEAAREQGLSGRTGLASDEGMLFVFARDGKYAFWMKDMLFSIDIIWISADRRTVYIASDVSPATYPEDFAPQTPARYVLEVPAGFAGAHGVKIGDIVGL